MSVRAVLNGIMSMESGDLKVEFKDFATGYYVNYIIHRQDHVDQKMLDEFQQRAQKDIEKIKASRELKNVGSLCYRGNTVSYIYDKMTCYKDQVGYMTEALKVLGVFPEGLGANNAERAKNLKRWAEETRELLRSPWMVDDNGHVKRLNTKPGGLNFTEDSPVEKIKDALRTARAAMGRLTIGTLGDLKLQEAHRKVRDALGLIE